MQDFFQRYYNSKDARMGEHPSSLICASARSIGKLAAYMANQGTFGGHRIMEIDTWNKLHDHQTLERMYGFGERMVMS